MALDRYAYVKNNPLRYNDPSGHYDIEDPGNVYVPPPPYKPTSEKLTPDPVVPSFNFESLGQPVPTPLPYYSATVVSKSDNMPTESEIAGTYMEQFLEHGFAYMKYVSSWNDAYRFWKGALPTGEVEFVIGAVMQGFQDADGNYTLYQRVFRAGIAGGEDYLLDAFANRLAAPIVAVLAFPETGPGAAAVYGVTGLIVNYAGEFVVEPWLNDKYFYPALGLEEKE